MHKIIALHFKGIQYMRLSNTYRKKSYVVLKLIDLNAVEVFQEMLQQFTGGLLVKSNFYWHVIYLCFSALQIACLLNL